MNNGNDGGHEPIAVQDLETRPESPLKISQLVRSCT